MFVLLHVGEEQTKVVGVSSTWDEGVIKQAIVDHVASWVCPPNNLSLDSIVEREVDGFYKVYDVFELGELYDEWNTYVVQKARAL